MERRRLQSRDLLEFRLAGDVQIDPSGSWVYYTLNTINKETNEYNTSIYRAAPGAEPVRFSGGETDHSPRLSPDGRLLAFVSKRSGQPQIWILPTTGGEAWQLTRVQGGVREMAWSPDGRHLAFTAMLDDRGIEPERKEDKDEDLYRKFTKGVKVIEELYHKLDGEGFVHERRPQVCVVEVRPGAEPRQLTRPPYRHQDLAWSPDGRLLLFSSRRGPDYDREPWETQVWRIPAGGGEPEPLTPKALAANSPAWSPDGRWIAFVAQKVDELGYDNPTVYVVPAEGGEPRALGATFDRPVGNQAITDLPAPGGMKLLWSPDSRSVFALYSDRGRVHLGRVALETGEVTLLTHGERVVYSAALDAGCRLAALGVAEPLDPSRIVLADLESGREDELAAPNRDLLAAFELTRPRRFTFRAPGGPEVDGWILEPAGREEGQRYPAVLEIHGGPMAMYGVGFFFEFHLLAAYGYGVIFTNPRGSLGYGHDFCAAIRDRWGDKDYADVMAGLEEALRLSPWIDPDRLGVAGGSYGGYMTNWIVGHTDRFKAAVTMRSVVDWSSMIGAGDVNWDVVKRAGGRWPWQDPEWYRQQSPITYVDRITTPLLIEHQEGDLRCPIDQGETLFTAVKALGKAPVRFVRYPNEFHGMSRSGKPWHRVHRLDQILDWFGRYLGPGAPAA